MLIAYGMGIELMTKQDTSEFFKEYRQMYPTMNHSMAFGIFWLDDDDEFKSCPQFTDGTVDIEQEDYVGNWTDLRSR